MAKVIVKVCPKCGSTDIFKDWVYFESGTHYICRKCGYRGVVVAEEEHEAK